MGTWLALSVPAPAGECGLAADRWARDVHTTFDLAASCERAMSRHDPGSDLARLNRAAGSPAEIASAPLAGALRVASRLSHRLDGAFDPTVGPLLELWRRASVRSAPPDPQDLERVLARVGVGALEIAEDRVRLRRRGMSLDLDGIGKGLALDRIVDALKRDGCASALLNFGESSLLAVGRPRRGHWTVALRDPAGGFVGTFSLRDRACSTSSTLARPIRVGRQIVGDVVDPRTGHLVTRDAQVTVLAHSAATAEAVSTALLVLGPDAVDTIADRLGVDICWIDRSGIRTTPWFILRRSARNAADPPGAALRV